MKNFIKSINGETQDWELVSLPIDQIKDPALFNVKHELSVINKPRNRKLELYLELIKKGVLFPPVIVDKDNNLKDGTHRLALYKLLGRKRLRVLRNLGKGSGKVKGTLSGRSTLPYKDASQHSGHKCLICKKTLDFLPPGVTVVLNSFPQGMPLGSYLYCKDCGMIYKNNFVVWKK